MASLPSLDTTTLVVRPWPDAVIDEVGHDPRSAYVERFWLALLGPSATWLLRRLVAGLEACPAGFELDLDVTARAIGLQGGGRSAPFARTLDRLCRFGMLVPAGRGEVAVRRRMPPLTRRQLRRLPDALQAEHESWIAANVATPTADKLRVRARRLALSLFELGEDVEGTERQLLRWRFHPVLAREATAWALARHRQAHEHPASARPGPDRSAPPERAAAADGATAS